MPVKDNGADTVSAPADYAALYTQYWDYVLTLVRRFGFEENKREDVAAEILLRFYERDFLSVFDPTLVFEYQGQERPARFKSFLTKFVLTYLRGLKDKQRRQANREKLLCDTLVGHQEIVPWVEVFGDTMPGADEYALGRLEEEDLVAELREYIKQVPRRSAFDTCDLVALYDAVIVQVRQYGVWDVAALRKQFGVSSTAMHSWLWWLRENLAAALDRPVPARRPRVVKK